MKGGYSKVNRTPSYRGSNHLNDFNDFTKKMKQNNFTPNDRKEVKKKVKSRQIKNIIAHRFMLSRKKPLQEIQKEVFIETKEKIKTRKAKIRRKKQNSKKIIISKKQDNNNEEHPLLI